MGNTNNTANILIISYLQCPQVFTGPTFPGRRVGSIEMRGFLRIFDCGKNIGIIQSREID